VRGGWRRRRWEWRELEERPRDRVVVEVCSGEVVVPLHVAAAAGIAPMSEVYPDADVDVVEAAYTEAEAEV
jgi:hypothetical protein